MENNLEENNYKEVNSDVKQQSEIHRGKTKKTKIIPILVITIIILIVLIVVSLYNMHSLIQKKDKVLDPIINIEEENENKQNEINVGTDKTIKENSEKPYIYERESYINIIKIPYININSDDAKKINQEIYKLYEEAVKTVKQEQGRVQEYTKIDYKYSILKNMISICIDKTDVVVPGGGFIPERIVYNINLSDGKILSTQKVLESLEITKEDLISKINLRLKKYYEEDKHNITIDNYLEGFEYDLDKIYFKSSSIVLVLVTGESVEYGYYEPDINILETLDSEIENEENVNEEEKLDYENFLGKIWRFKDNTNLDQDKEVIIYDINDEEITFQMYAYRGNEYDSMTVKLKNNTADFKIENKDEEKYIEGSITLTDTSILLNIEDSNDINFNVGTTYESSYYLKYEDFIGTWESKEGTEDKINLVITECDRQSITCQITINDKEFEKKTKQFPSTCAIYTGTMLADSIEGEEIADFYINLTEEGIGINVRAGYGGVARGGYYDLIKTNEN